MVCIIIAQNIIDYLNDYNLAVLFGPETDVKILGEQFKDINWSGMGVGFGVRGSRRPDITIQFESKFRLLSDMKYFWRTD